MLDGIKLLIERMDQHPEEFFGDLSFRWSDVMQDIAKHGPEFLDEQDIMMLNMKVKEIRRKELSAKITEEIATQARLQVAQERHGKVGVPVSQYGAAIAKGEGQKVWWTDNGNSALIGVDTARNLTSGYDPNSETFFGRGLLDMIERGKDNATLQNIRATNRDLEAQLAQSKAEIARRDAQREQSRAYKKRNNQNWK
jgi:hypothetical protein